jgi:hypothetical protein
MNRKEVVVTSLKKVYRYVLAKNVNPTNNLFYILFPMTRLEPGTPRIQNTHNHWEKIFVYCSPIDNLHHVTLFFYVVQWLVCFLIACVPQIKPLCEYVTL